MKWVGIQMVTYSHDAMLLSKNKKSTITHTVWLSLKITKKVTRTAENKLVNYDRLQISNWPGMRSLDEERRNYRQAKGNSGAQNISKLTRIYNDAICILFHSKAVKSIPKGKNVFRNLTYHPYPPKHCIPKIKIYMRLSSRKSILRNSLISLVCIFLKQDLTVWFGLTGNPFCLLPRLPSSTQSSWLSLPSQTCTITCWCTGICHHTWLAYAFVFHPLQWGPGC